MSHRGSTRDRLRPRSFVEGAALMFALGIPGVLFVGASSLDDLHSLPQVADVPTHLLFLLAVAQPLVLLALACLVGTALIPCVRLHSHVLYRVVGTTQPPVLFAEELPASVGVGVVLALAVLVLDGAFAAFVPGLSSLLAVAANDATVYSVAVGLLTKFLYGGITEELLVRYGFMTFVAWVLWKLTGGDRPSSGVMWAAIAVSAVAFGAGHLPVLAATAAVTPALVVQVVFLNALVGVGLGWLYWQNSIESAMAGHVTFHLVVVASLAVLP
ncbi:CPBP family intramembrane glutamic endopeptidase [Haladaptatus sp. CMAA 1911]|uniref:CPBP family intramembrane glutamic endopeptidase n=1 Tax=unclassified Haladaptatus TaxID=2622732 RepID=UPI0037552CBD